MPDMEYFYNQDNAERVPKFRDVVENDFGFITYDAYESTIRSWNEKTQVSVKKWEPMLMSWVVKYIELSNTVPTVVEYWSPDYFKYMTAVNEPHVISIGGFINPMIYKSQPGELPRSISNIIHNRWQNGVFHYRLSFEKFSMPIYVDIKSTPR